MSDYPAELAVRRRLYETFGWSPTSEVCRTAARAAVEAARPIIEADVLNKYADLLAGTPTRSPATILRMNADRLRGAADNGESDAQ